MVISFCSALVGKMIRFDEYVGNGLNPPSSLLMNPYFIFPTLSGTEIQSYRPIFYDDHPLHRVTAPLATDQFMMTHGPFMRGFVMARQWRLVPGSGFDQMFFMFTPIWGKKVHFDSYVSIGLKPPTRCSHEMD